MFTDLTHRLRSLIRRRTVEQDLDDELRFHLEQLVDRHVADGLAHDEAMRLTPVVPLTLEQSIAYIEDDELVEVTPKSIRLRKKLLDENDRKKEERKKEAETV